MKKMLLIIGGVLIILIVGTIILINMINSNYNKSMSKLTISDVDMSKLSDGIYRGNYKIFPIAVEVELVVKDQKIIKINIIKHQNGKGKPAEVITKKIIEKQSLNVDTISGATGSSKVILKAIEVALNSAIK